MTTTVATTAATVATATADDPQPIDESAPAAGDALPPQSTDPVSLLWPPGHAAAPGPQRLDGPTLADLDLRDVIRVLAAGDPRREAFVTAVLAELPSDHLITYRQEVLEALLEDEPLRRGLAQVAAALAEAAQLRAGHGRSSWSVSIVARRVMELEAYVRVALQLLDELSRSPAVSRGTSTALSALRAHLAALTGSEQFRALRQELPKLRATLDRVRSITIGVNLTKDLSPDSATILAISAEKVEGRSPLLDRLFGKGAAERALSPLHDVDLGNPGNPLTRDLQKLLGAVVGPVADAMRRYTGTNAASLDHLERELSFLLGGVELTRRLERAGLPTCRPDVAPAEARVTVLHDAYNVGLALRTLAERKPHDPELPPGAGIVTNTVTFDGDLGRVWILTGPNRGGKTTYTRAVGQAHVLFQAGLRVPARAGRMSPVGAIYTHFPTGESEQLGMGKLDEEAQRLAHIFSVAFPTGLILLNEVLAGTSAIEALGLATDAVRALRLLGVRAIYTTHLHDLPARAAEINASTPGASLVGSLVAGIEDAAADPPSPATGGPPHATVRVIGSAHRRTFHIQPGPPNNVSYASEIAEQHGISFAQLQRLFQQRGVLLQDA